MCKVISLKQHRERKNLSGEKRVENIDLQLRVEKIKASINRITEMMRKWYVQD